MVKTGSDTHIMDHVPIAKSKLGPPRHQRVNDENCDHTIVTNTREVVHNALHTFMKLSLK